MLDGAEFVSDNINWCMQPQLKIPQRYILNLFSSPRDINSSWTAIVRNCDTTVNGRNGGMGIGTLHGSLNENHVALINYKHCGGGLMDLKNSDPECVMYLTLKNVETDYLTPEEFNPVAIPCKIKFTNDFSGFNLNGSYGSHCAEIADPFSFELISNQFYNRGWNNRMNLIHIDRFVFWLPSAQFLMKMVDPILGNKTDWKPNDNNTLTNIGKKVILNQIPRVGDKVELTRDYSIQNKQKNNLSKNVVRSFSNRILDSITKYPVELQVGDIIKINEINYKIIHKERGSNWNIEHEWRELTNQESQYVYSNLTLDKDLPDSVSDFFEATIIKSCSEYLLDGEYRDAYIMYKGNSQIDLKEDTQFGDKQVLYAQAFYHLSYNHAQISLWAENVKHNGFYRQSTGQGKTLGYNMINCEGFKNEFNPPLNITTEKPIPERIEKIIKIWKQ